VLPDHPRDIFGKRVILAVAQLPFESTSDLGTVNSFATLVPILTMDGEALDRADFRYNGLVFWMVRQRALGFADPGRLIAGKLAKAVNPLRAEYQLSPDSSEVAQPAELIEVLTVENPQVREPRGLVNTDAVLVLDHPPTPLVLVRWGDNVFGPFRTEVRPTRPGCAPWQVDLSVLSARLRKAS
jgi:hypothetical protein